MVFKSDSAKHPHKSITKDLVKIIDGRCGDKVFSVEECIHIFLSTVGIGSDILPLSWSFSSKQFTTEKQTMKMICHGMSMCMAILSIHRSSHPLLNFLWKWTVN